MTAKTVTSNGITCNVCGNDFEDEDNGIVLLFDKIGEAVGISGHHEWIVHQDGFALCPDDDESHASVRESLTPAEPTPEIPGQLDLTAPAAADGGA